MPHTTAPGRAMFLLLSPKAGPPEAHLQVLAELARQLHLPGIVDRLARAGSPAEARELLS